MQYIISAIIGYLFGCINGAYIISRCKGVNIKKVGTNNAGASNVFITVGKAYGVVVALIDISKTFLAAYISFVLFKGDIEVALFAGIMSILGHIFPFWMKFRGGKGLASFMGLILFYDFGLFAIFGVLLIAITLITDYISVAALTLPMLLTIYMAFFEHEYFIAALLLCVTLIIWYKHKENIIRIKNGNEFGFLRKNKYKK